MKKLIGIFTGAALLFGLTACSSDHSPLSESSAKKALEREAMFAKDSQVGNFNTGFYEVSEGNLRNLARLAAAGMVTYTTESVIEKREEREWKGYWTGYVTKMVDVPHVFAEVALTDAGKKYVVDDPTVVRSDLRKVYKANKDYTEPQPDYMNADDDAFRKMATRPVSPADDTEVEEIVVEEVEEAPVVEPVTVPADNTNARYNALMAKTSITGQQMLLGRYKIEEITQVMCPEDMFKAGRGSCVVLYKFVDKTPFGYVLGAPSEGQLQDKEISFVLYQDLGWTVGSK